MTVSKRWLGVMAVLFLILGLEIGTMIGVKTVEVRTRSRGYIECVRGGEFEAHDIDIVGPHFEQLGESRLMERIYRALCTERGI